MHHYSGTKSNKNRVNATVCSLMSIRISFFSFVLRQDVAFFDANKTGLLVNRLTADIQEFKSSFKLVISQVRGAIRGLCCGLANSTFSAV